MKLLVRDVDEQHHPRLDDLKRIVGPRKRVALRLPSGQALAELLWLCWRKGAVAIPVDPFNPLGENIIEHADPHILVDYEDVTEREVQFESEADDRLILYTSGSTGDPKGVVLTKGAVAHNAMAFTQWHGIDYSNYHATPLPLHHCNAICASLIGTVMTGSKLLIYDKPFNAAEFFDELGYWNVATANVVPALLERIVRDAPPWPRNLKYLITAAAPLSPSLATIFEAIYGQGRLKQGYGMTEATNFTTTMRADTELDAANLTVGVPIHPEYQIKLSDEGEVLMRGPHLMRGYWRDDVSSMRANPDGWLRTGDVGEINEEGQLVLKSRSKETINVNGETTYPQDWENVWTEHGIPAETVAFRIETPEGDAVGAILPLPVPSSGHTAHFFAQVPSRWRPSVVQIGDCPRTATGKPQRNKLTQRFTALTDGDYSELLSTATLVAAMIAAKPEPASDVARAVHASAQALVATAKSSFVPKDLSDDLEGPAYEVMQILLDRWDDIAAGRLDGLGLFKEHKGLWEKLMTEYPMGVYPIHLSGHLDLQQLLLAGDKRKLRVLELGAGVGNASSLVEGLFDFDDEVEKKIEWIRTDLDPGLPARHSFGGRVRAYNFDQRWDEEPVDVIYGVNCVHCAQDVPSTMAFLYDALAPGGTLVLAEGAPHTHNGVPWALDFLFQLMPGWNDRTGFLPRSAWVGSLLAEEFT